MVFVQGVERGVTLLQLPLSTAVADLLAQTAQAAGVTPEDLLIFTSEGELINGKATLSGVTDTEGELFALRRGSLSCKELPEEVERDWRTFRDFPAHDAYEESFCFEGDWAGQALQEDERLLFDLTVRARKAFALYFLHLRKYDRLAEKLKIRSSACPVLLKSIKLYYKRIKSQFTSVRHQLETLKAETFPAAQSFKARLKALQAQDQLAPYVQLLLKDGNLKNCGKAFAASLRSLENKLSEVESLLEDSKKTLREKLTRAKSRISSLTRFFEVYYSTEVRPGDLASALHCCALYRQLRLALNSRNSAEVESVRDRIDEVLDLVETAERTLAELEECGRQGKEESTRVAALFKEVVTVCAEKATRLAHRGQHKLAKFMNKIAALNRKKELLDFPTNFPVACEAALCEIERRRSANQFLSAMYAELCHHIVTEEERRCEFVTSHGQYLPRDLFGELEGPVMPRSLLRHLLTIDTREVETSSFGALEDCYKGTILHYEKELKQAEVQRLQDQKELAQKCERLERDLKDAAIFLQRLEGEKKELQIQVQNYSVELGLLREETRGSELRMLHAEITKLQRKEAAFKEGWVEQVQSLELEVKLLRARERKKSRTTDLP